MSNREEYIADTDPEDSRSRLDVRMIPLGNSAVLEWIGGSAVTQYVEGAEDLGTWSPVYTNVPPTKTTNWFKPDVGGSLKYFRIRVTR